MLGSFNSLKDQFRTGLADFPDRLLNVEDLFRAQKHKSHKTSHGMLGDLTHQSLDTPIQTHAEDVATAAVDRRNASTINPGSPNNQKRGVSRSRLALQMSLGNLQPTRSLYRPPSFPSGLALEHSRAALGGSPGSRRDTVAAGIGRCRLGARAATCPGRTSLPGSRAVPPSR